MAWARLDSRATYLCAVRRESPKPLRPRSSLTPIRMRLCSEPMCISGIATPNSESKWQMYFATSRFFLSFLKTSLQKNKANKFRAFKALFKWLTLFQNRFFLFRKKFTVILFAILEKYKLKITNFALLPRSDNIFVSKQAFKVRICKCFKKIFKAFKNIDLQDKYPFLGAGIKPRNVHIKVHMKHQLLVEIAFKMTFDEI